MTLQSLSEMAESGQVVDIWKVANVLLDWRNELEDTEDKQKVEAMISELGIQPEGPSIVLSDKVKRLIEMYHQ